MEPEEEGAIGDYEGGVGGGDVPSGNVSPRDCNSIHVIDDQTRGFKTDHELDIEYCAKKELGEHPDEPFDNLEFCVFDVDESEVLTPVEPRPDLLPAGHFS
eukprot:TRINITY_DN5053_c0_g1_i1.p1 TRINITY_DN5053_c0_g1~~TRINITY_DN5053_c0_g1_i1.p1  ORF type:complete len:101 (+),score=16.42 TRINITY_DN5053_c0_g1_i1:186-488(+)